MEQSCYHIERGKEERPLTSFEGSIDREFGAQELSSPVCVRNVEERKRDTDPPPQSRGVSLVLAGAAYMGTSLEDLCCSCMIVSIVLVGGCLCRKHTFILILLEVFDEESAKLLNLALEVGCAVPALSRVEQLVGNVGTCLGNRQVERLIRLELDLGELAAVDGVEDGAGVLEGAALAAGGSAGTDPAGVEQPRIGAVLLDLLREHLGIAHGVQRQEGLGEA